jgi:hypothetical protein
MTERDSIDVRDGEYAAALKFSNRLGSVVLWGLMLSPVLLLLDILLLGAHVRLALGHWPNPMVENYSSPAFTWHSRGVVYFGLFAAYGALPLWLLLCFRSLRRRRWTHLSQLGAFIVGWAAVIAYMQFDPHRFVAWFMD